MHLVNKNKRPRSLLIRIDAHVAAENVLLRIVHPGNDERHYSRARREHCSAEN